MKRRRRSVTIPLVAALVLSGLVLVGLFQGIRPADVRFAISAVIVIQLFLIGAVSQLSHAVFSAKADKPEG